MAYILSESSLIACDSGMNENFYDDPKINVKTEYKDEFVKLVSFRVNIRSWQNASITDRFIKVRLPEITAKIVKKGAVIIFLHEMKRYASLPFTYYQQKQALSFQPSYEPGFAYINILGHFIFTANSDYFFKILIVEPKGYIRYGKINLYNYENLKFLFQHNILPGHEK